jgi:hypothetical protein
MEERKLQVEPHHEAGTPVQVVIGRDGRTALGVVAHVVGALDRDYRVAVNFPDGRAWLHDAAPECVLPQDTTADAIKRAINRATA